MTLAACNVKPKVSREETAKTAREVVHLMEAPVGKSKVAIAQATVNRFNAVTIRQESARNSVPSGVV